MIAVVLLAQFPFMPLIQHLLLLILVYSFINNELYVIPTLVQFTILYNDLLFESLKRVYNMVVIIPFLIYNHNNSNSMVCTIDNLSFISG